MGNLVMKIIPMILQERIKSIIPKVISNEQASFISGRNIYSNIGLASEFMNGLESKKRGGICLLKWISSKLMALLNGVFSVNSQGRWDARK